MDSLFFERVSARLATPEKSENIAADRVQVLQLFLEAFRKIGPAIALFWLREEPKQQATDGLLTLWAMQAAEFDASGCQETFACLRCEDSIESEIVVQSVEASGRIGVFLDVVTARMTDPDIPSELLGMARSRGKSTLRRLSIPLLHPYHNIDGGEPSLATIGVVDLVFQGKPQSIDRLLADRQEISSVRSLANLFAARLQSGRRERVLRALDAFQHKIGNTDEYRSVCKHACDVLVEFASAEYCAILGESRLGRWNEIANSTGASTQFSIASDDSIATHFLDTKTLQMKSGVARLESIDDFTAVADRLSQFAPDTLNDGSRAGTGCHSWLFASVTCREYRTGKSAPLFLIVMRTRARHDFLGGSFSATDEAIVERVGRYLSTIVPGLIFRSVTARLVSDTQKMAGVNDAASGQKGTSPRSDSTLPVEADYTKIAFKSIPIASDCLLIDILSRDGDVQTQAYAHDGRPLETNLPPFNPNRDKCIQTFGDRYCWYSKIIEQAQEKRGLLLVLERPTLAEHFGQIVEFIASELRLRELAELDFADRKRQLGEIRHALRAPLYGLLGHLAVARTEYMQAIENQELRDSFFSSALFRKSLERALLSGHQISSMFEGTRLELMSLSRADLQLSNVDVAKQVRDVITILLPMSRRRNIAINLVDDYAKSDLPDPVCDQQLISLAIFNLLENALKYSFSGKNNPPTAIKVRYWAEKKNWCLSVTDEGRYIPPDLHHAIFMPFYRPPPVRGQQQMPGTGLGLASVAKVVELHSPGDSVDVASVLLTKDSRLPRARTTFTIRLPRQPSPQ